VKWSAAVLAAGSWRRAVAMRATRRRCRAALVGRSAGRERRGLEVAPETFEDQVGITGTVEAERDVTVSAEESGVMRS
jgi:hypothetical protein